MFRRKIRPRAPADEATSAKNMGAIYRPDTALIFSMGKVGSTAICRSLDKIGYSYLHFQFLNPAAITTLMRDHGPKPANFSYINTKHYYELIRYHLTTSSIGSVQQVITAVREPISYLLSFYFHAIENFKHDIEERNGPISTNAIIEHFHYSMDWFFERRHWSLERLANESKDISPALVLFHYGARNTLNWFDEEFQRYTGIDVYSKDLRGNPWSLISNALILRFEDYSTGEAEKAVQQFIGRPTFKMLERNVGEKKKYSRYYKDVKSDIKFHLDVLNYFYDSRYTTNFYTDVEINDMLNKWKT